MYNYDDENIDWKEINDCCDILYNTCRKWGRLGGQIKEKYGTVRFYAQFHGISLHNLFYPGYVAYQWPRWFTKFDRRIATPVLNLLFGKLFFKYQVFMYRLGYKKCLKKYPHLKREITSCMDFPEFLK